MNTDASAQSMVSMQEVDENMSLVQKNVSLIIDVHQNEINKLKKQLQEEQERNRVLEQENKELKEQILLIGKKIAEMADISEPHKDTVLRMMNADDEVIGNYLCVLAEIKHVFSKN